MSWSSHPILDAPYSLMKSGPYSSSCSSTTPNLVCVHTPQGPAYIPMTSSVHTHASAVLGCDSMGPETSTSGAQAQVELPSSLPPSQIPNSTATIFWGSGVQYDSLTTHDRLQLNGISCNGLASSSNLLASAEGFQNRAAPKVPPSINSSSFDAGSSSDGGSSLGSLSTASSFVAECEEDSMGSSDHHHPRCASATFPYGCGEQFGGDCTAFGNKRSFEMFASHQTETASNYPPHPSTLASAHEELTQAASGASTKQRRLQEQQCSVDMIMS